MGRVPLLACLLAAAVGLKAGTDDHPAVGAEMGGPGFEKIAERHGWTTSSGFPLLGDPDAIKGGDLVTTIHDYPGGMKPVGPQANGYLLIWCYETLLDRHPETEEWIPGLATHWKFSEDKLSVSYRLDPAARWPDGSPVTSRDVRATYDYFTDETGGEPWRTEELRPYGRPAAESPSLFTIRMPSKGRRAFYNLNSVPILPASALAPFRTAGEFARSKTADFLGGTGPYEMRPEDQIEGQTIVFRRRPGYWNARGRANVGRWNFDRIVLKAVPDEAMAFERFKKGEFNFLGIASPARWVRDLTPEKVPALARGQVVKCEIPIEKPGGGFGGLALNMTRAPLDDLRVRKALAHLLDRERIIRMIFHGQLVPIHSLWSGTPYENPGNVRFDHDPAKALALLGEAGWRRNPRTGLLQRADGTPLRLKLTYHSPDEERYLTLYQESLKQAGIVLTLDQTTFENKWALLMERKFQMATYRIGSSLPEPGIGFLGAHAAKPVSDNVWGFSDPRVDRLIEAYESSETGQEEAVVRTLRELDGLITQQVPVILTWRDPSLRIAAWDTLRRPDGISCRRWFEAAATWWKTK